MRFGVTERLEFVDAPGHAADLKRNHARGYRMGNRIVNVTDNEADLIEVRTPSRGMVDPSLIAVEHYPPAAEMRRGNVDGLRLRGNVVPLLRVIRGRSDHRCQDPSGSQ